MSKLTRKNKNILQSRRNTIIYILFISYLFLLSMNAILITIKTEWIIINILAVISIGFGIWYST